MLDGAHLSHSYRFMSYGVALRRVLFLGTCGALISDPAHAMTFHVAAWSLLAAYVLKLLPSAV